MEGYALPGSATRVEINNEPSIPYGARYKFSVPKLSNCRVNYNYVYPTNNGTFTDNAVIRIPINSAGFVDLKQSFVSYTAGVTVITGTSATIMTSAHQPFSKVSLISSATGAVIETVNDYNILAGIMHRHVINERTNPYEWGLGTADSLAVDGSVPSNTRTLALGGFSIAGTVGTTYSSDGCVMTPLLGCFLNHSFMPVCMMSGGLELQLTVAPAAQVFTTTTAANLSAGSFKDVRFNMCEIHLDPLYIASLRSYTMTAPLTFKYSTFAGTMKSVAANATQDTIVSYDKTSSLKAILATSIIPANVHVANGNKSVFALNGMTSIAFRVGSTNYAYELNTSALRYNHLRLALGNLSDVDNYNSVLSLPLATYTAADATDSGTKVDLTYSTRASNMYSSTHSVYGVATSILSENNFMTGHDTLSSNEAIYVTVTNDGSTNAAAYWYVFTYMDKVLSIDSLGITTVIH